MTPLLIAVLLAAPKIPYVAEDKVGPPDLVAAIRARRPGGKLWNLDRMLLNSPAIRGQLSLPGKLREISIMAIAVLNKADYEWAAHEPELKSAGGSAEQIAALKDPVAASKNEKLFDEPERAALALAIEMTREVQVQDATLKRVRAALSDQQVVELIGTIAAYNMVSRFLVATGVEPDPR